ncbi:urease accessory protein UreF [Arsenicitalea aurantiaca]|uniref:Urease accessory protein UreF n=1 Tax=Arsenicitalea aurantiaca TaxID=1783274 RepID=A0A433XLV9_9HYPH|nr:urease accessory UreF family protein [Arsenicitalea aurantiaca]RUT35077.1 urease accessory protein UreF [Arsenicitalea aurantiaca]
MIAHPALQRLLVWLSPAFPIGGFAWSAGLETAIAEGRVSDSSSMRNWLEGNLAHGGMRTDAILLAEAARSSADADALREIADLALAFAPAAERRAEMLAMGDAFIAAAAAWPSPHGSALPRPCPYPVAVGAIAGAHGVGIEDTVLAFLTNLVHGQISVALRLVPLGQTEGLAILAGLEQTIAQHAQAAAVARLDDIGTIAYASDIAQMRHETETTRLFRS